MRTKLNVPQKKKKKIKTPRVMTCCYLYMLYGLYKIDSSIKKCFSLNIVFFQVKM